MYSRLAALTPNRDFFSSIYAHAGADSRPAVSQYVSFFCFRWNVCVFRFLQITCGFSCSQFVSFLISSMLCTTAKLAFFL